MRTLTLRNRFQGNSTLIENDFIDNYMAKANGEYVKVYLLLLRHLSANNTSLTISKLADYLECTEKDILRALNHWSNVGLLKIDYDEAGTICGLAIGKGSSSSSTASAGAVSKNTELEKQDKPSFFERAKKKVTAKSLASEHQEELRQLYFVAEQYMGKPLSVTEIQKINYFFDQLNFSTDLIEYLIEYCVENGHKSMHYIESVALAWSDANISSVADAKANASSYNKNYFAILKAFGISGRNPAPVEISYMKKWTEEYGFPLDIILEACNRTITNTAKPDFKYTDSILTNWFSKGVHHIGDVNRLDLAHQQERSARKKPTSKPVNMSGNRFNNFEGRSYDMTSLEQQLLNTQ